MTHPANTLSLVADVGGTNTRCALTNGADVLPATVRRYANANHTGLEAVLRQYVRDEGDVDTVAACVAVAGPVRDGRATLTNLDWAIDGGTLARATGAETVAILNDLQAQGHALSALEPASLRTIITGPKTTNTAVATRLVVGVGTGFNAAPVFATASGTFVPPSESGHVTLPTRTDQDVRLSAYVSAAHGFPSVEDVLSGRGLERVYAFLGREAATPKSATAKDIMTGCADGSDPLAAQAAGLFSRILGAVCGNLALTQLPFGGVYLVGGVARSLAPYLASFGFADAFCDKGRFRPFMSNFAVDVVEDDYAALIGSAAHLEAVKSA
ncbi:glucokinase [Octadecabacter sp.]|nr:glucokinase [Octadecabacter sp.]